MKNRGRRFTMAASAAGLVTLIAAAVASRGFVHERYLVWQAEHGDPETQARAVDALVSMDSAAALPLLIQYFASNLRARHLESLRPWRARLERASAPHPSFSELTAPFLQLHRSHKKAATLALEAALSDPSTSVRAAACLLIAVLGPERDSDGLVAPLVQLLKADPDAWVRELACNALVAIVADRPAAQTALEEALGEDDLANVQIAMQRLLMHRMRKEQ
jgi:HEAT repeat protein